MISSTEAHKKMHEQVDQAQAEFDRQVAVMRETIPKVIEALTTAMLVDDNLVAHVASDIADGALVTQTNALVFELLTGVVFPADDDEVIIDSNRAIVALVLELKAHSEHLSQALAELYHRLVEPLAIDEHGYIFPDIEPSTAVDRILQTVQGGPKTVEATMEGSLVVDL